jgi:hypothetical protein
MNIVSYSSCLIAYPLNTHKETYNEFKCIDQVMQKIAIAFDINTMKKMNKQVECINRNR